MILVDRPVVWSGHAVEDLNEYGVVAWIDP
jgi:hypothetical protein